jgi:colicin import membrane protein
VKRIPVATELGHKDRFWPAVLASIAVHGAAIGLAVRATSLPTIELEQTPIQARLVRLGEKKPESYLPQKETPPPPPAPAEPAPPAPTPPPPTEPPNPPPAAPAPDAMPPPPADATATAQPKPGPTRPARPSSTKNPANGGGASSIDALLAKASKDVQREKWGDPNGDPQGDSEEGTEGDKYDALVRRAIRNNYRVPSTIPERERIFLEANVRIWVEPDGTVSNWKIEKPSGNPVFDQALLRAVGDARLPPPPAELRSAYQNRGRLLKFNLKNE